jgi:hypothetical protein
MRREDKNDRVWERMIREADEAALAEHERGARAWLASMAELADRVAESGKALPDDLRRMKWGRKRAEAAFNEIAASFLEPLREERPDVADRGYLLLWDLMAGSHLIAASSTISDSARRKAMAIFTDKGAVGGKLGAGTNQAKAKARWREIEQIAERIAVGKKRKLSKRAYAKKVLSRWPDGKKKPSETTVKRRLEVIQKDGKISLAT